MHTSTLLFLALVACSGDEVDVSLLGPDEAPRERVGPPAPPTHPSGPGTFQVAWTTSLTEPNRTGPPLPAGTSVEVVAVNGDVATIRTTEDPPRAGKMPVHRLIAGNRMQPGITVDSAVMSEEPGDDAGESVPAFTMVLPYEARTGARAVITADGEPRWIAGSALLHDAGDLSVGASVAAIRWSLDAGDERSARLRVRALEAAAPSNSTTRAARRLFSGVMGEDEPFELRGDRVHDPKSKLTWKRCADGQGFLVSAGRCDGIAMRREYDAANDACSAIQSDDGAWRLPTVDEILPLRLCASGPLGESGCPEAQLGASLPAVFGLPAGRVWTSDERDGGRLLVDLSNGEVVSAEAEEQAMALCTTEAFDGNTYLQTAGDTSATRRAAAQEGEEPETLDEDMLYLTAMPAHVPEDEYDDLIVQLRTPAGIRWVRRSDLKRPAFPLQANPVEPIPLDGEELRSGRCEQIFGPSDRITAGEDVRVVGPGESTGTLIVEVERGCKGSNGLTFRNVAAVTVRGGALKVRSDAEDPCRDIATRVPPTMREIMSGRLPNHPVLCAEWRFESVEPFFPGTTEQYRAFLEQDVVVDASAFTGWVVDGQLVRGDTVVPDAVYRGDGFSLVASTQPNIQRRTEELVVHRATLYAWQEVTRRLKTGGSSHDESFTFDAETGDLTGSQGLHCAFQEGTGEYRCE